MALSTKSYALTMENGGKQLLERQIIGYVSANIDGKTVGNTTAMTTHADLGRFVVLGIVIYSVNIDGLELLPFFSFGVTGAGYTDLSAASQLAANGTDVYDVRFPGAAELGGSAAQSVAPSTNIVARVDPAGTGTTLTYAVYVRGFYIG